MSSSSRARHTSPSRSETQPRTGTITVCAGGASWGIAPEGSGAGGLADASALAAVDREDDAGDEGGVIRMQEERGVGDVPAAPLLAPQRHLAVAGGAQFIALKTE